MVMNALMPLKEATMTKTIRVENADNSNHQVVVQVFDKAIEPGQDTLVVEYFLNHPADMTPRDLCIWKGRYLVVKEVE
jgi:hypothetical protein